MEPIGTMPREVLGSLHSAPRKSHANVLLLNAVPEAGFLLRDSIFKVP